MKNKVISLPKIGNIKLGLVSSGRPISTERLLVTLASKENTENFKTYPGFSEEGEESLNISLPFNDPDLNFETSYVGFVLVNDIEYMLKANDFGDLILGYPLEGGLDLPVYNFGELNEETMEKFKMKIQGLLRAMIDGVSGFGEVFYFKTGSFNTISAISSQLKLIEAGVGSLAGLPLTLKPVKKEAGGNEIVYVSVSIKGDVFETVKTYKKRNKKASIDFSLIEEMYVSSRETESVDFDFDNIPYIVQESYESNVAKISPADKKESVDKEYIASVLKKSSGKIPMSVAESLFLSFGNKEEFEAVISDDTLDIPGAMKIIKERVNSRVEKPVKKRGRPRKEKTASDEAPKRKRGRPRKTETKSENPVKKESGAEPKRKRGRPRKTETAVKEEEKYVGLEDTQAEGDSNHPQEKCEVSCDAARQLSFDF